MLLVRNTLHRSLDPHISGPVTLLGRLITLPFDTDALVVIYVAPLIPEPAFVTGLVAFLIRLVTLIRG